jgi:glycosyltransferase involved in cell wall biosynthesis
VTAPRVLFVDHTGALGGAELYLLDVVRLYPGEAHVVLFETGPFADRLREAGASVEVLKAEGALLDMRRSDGLPGALRALPGILSLAVRLARRARHYDVVFANSQKALIIGAMAAWLARRPLVWNLHDILTADHFSALNRKVAVTIANRFARRVIVNSEATLRAFREAGGAAETCTVVYNGVDLAPFDAVRQEDAVALRCALGLEGIPVIGVFSRLAPWKGQHVVVEALPQLPGVHAVLVGSALFGEEAYEEELRRLCERFGVADRVHLLGFRRDVAPLMKCCDVVVHSSVSPEPFGRVIIEAMAAGRPVVATRAGGALEIVTEGETGLLVEPGDSGGLARSVATILGDDELRSHLSAEAGAHVRATFSLEVTVGVVAEVIEVAVGGHARAEAHTG